MAIAKVSISLDEQLLDFLEGYKQKHGVKSRSEVVSRGLALLREQELKHQYEQAMGEWEAETVLWEAVAADGLLAEEQP